MSGVRFEPGETPSMRDLTEPGAGLGASGRAVVVWAQPRAPVPGRGRPAPTPQRHGRLGDRTTEAPARPPARTGRGLVGVTVLRDGRDVLQPDDRDPRAPRRERRDLVLLDACLDDEIRREERLRVGDRVL